MAKKRKRARSSRKSARDLPIDDLSEDDGGDGGINDSDQAHTDHDTDDEEESPQTKAGTKKRTDSAANTKGKEQNGTNKKRTSDGKMWNSLKFEQGTDQSRPPINNFADFMAEFLDKLLNAGFEEVIKHLNGRKLRVATACSGTEAPILFLNVFSEGLRKRGIHFKFEHVFSCEIEPSKQAHIRRNFPGVPILRDITEVFGWKDNPESIGSMHTAFGVKHELPLPGTIDLIVVGTSCTSFSNLNSQKNIDLEIAETESSRTFRAYVRLIEHLKPKIAVSENVIGGPFKAMVHMLGNHGYIGGSAVVDSKHYGIPQTRQRGYLIALPRSSLEELGTAELYDDPKEWKELFATMRSKLSCPASTGIEQWMEKSDSKSLRSQVELQGDPRSVVSWDTCHARHEDYRHGQGLGTGKPITDWRSTGVFRHPDHWIRNPKGFVERVHDTTDVSHLRGVSRGYDDRYISRNIDLSQNVYVQHDNVKCGIMPCLTPSGAMFNTARGSKITGEEALRLQGIDTAGLELGGLSQPELRNFAGNAMTTTVVGAVMTFSLLRFFMVLPHGDDVDTPMEDVVTKTFRGEENMVNSWEDIAVVQQPLTVGECNHIAEASAKFCYCEAQTDISRSTIVKCKNCGHVSCSTCGVKPRHAYEPLSQYVGPRGVPGMTPRIPPSSVEFNIAGRLPMIVFIPALFKSDFKMVSFIEELGTGDVDNGQWAALCEPLLKCLQSTVKFHKPVRSFAWNFTWLSDNARLELLLAHNKIQWLLYAIPERTVAVNSPLRKYLERFPIARTVPIYTSTHSSKSMFDCTWQLWQPKIRIANAEITYGGKLISSYQKSIGLPEYAGDFVCSQMTFKIPDDQLTTFGDVGGVFKAITECGGAFNSMHKKEGTEGSDNLMFLFYDHAGGTGNWNKHGFVFSDDRERKECGVFRQIVASLGLWEQPLVQQVREGYKCGDRFYEDLAALQQGISGTVEITSYGSWITTSRTTSPMATSSLDSSSLVAYQKLDPLNPKLLAETTCKDLISAFSCKAFTDATPRYWQANCWTKVTKQNGIDFFKDCHHLLARGLVTPGKIEADPPWIPFNNQDDSTWRCHQCAPPKPDMLWQLKQICRKKQQTPFENPTAAAEFEFLSKNTPPATEEWVRFLPVHNYFQFEYQFLINPLTLGHRAAGLLDAFPRPEVPVVLSWRFIPGASGNVKLPTKEFNFLNTERLTMSDQPDRFVAGMKLRNEQLKTLTWMVNQERFPPEFMESEVVEACQDNLAFRLEGRASRIVKHRAGLLAAAVGYGKTVMTFALMCRQRSMDRMWSQNPNTDGLIHIKATLVMVPAHLTIQWRDESCLFLGFEPKEDPRLIVLNKCTDFKNLTVEAIRGAELVICNSGQFDNDGYLQVVARNAGVVELAKNSTDRAKSTWYINAQAKRKANLLYLQERLQMEEDESNDPAVARSRAQAVQDYIGMMKEQFIESFEAAGVHQPHMPTRRLTGAALTKSLENSKDGDKGKANAKISVNENDAEKSFGPPRFETHSVDGLAGVSLADFSWARLLVDEVGYMVQKNVAAMVSSMVAQSRWALSATPCITDHVSASRIARCLGINLGVDDQEVVRNDKNLTSAERFLSYGPDASPSWHAQRLQVAQNFCNLFVRHDKRKGNGQYHRIHRFVMTQFATAQLASYLTVKSDVINKSYMMPKTTNTRSSVQLEMMKIYGKEQDGRLRLTKAASFFPEHAKRDTNYTLKTCKNLKAIALSEINVAKDYMRRQIEIVKFLLTLQVVIDDPELSGRFNNWEAQCLEGERFPDPDAILDIIQVINSVRQSKPKTKDELYFEVPYAPHGRRAWPSPTQKVMHRGRKMLGLLAECRRGIVELHRTSMDLIHSRQEYRYYRAVLKIDQAGSSSPTGDLTCNCCNNNSPLSEAVVQGNCGHILCAPCNVIESEGNCPIHTCGGTSLDDQKYLASSLYSSAGNYPESNEPRAERLESYFSQFWTKPVVRVDKMSALRSIIWKHDDGQTKFIVFSPLPEYLLMAQKMVEADGIPCINLKGKKNHVALVLENFKQNRGMNFTEEPKRAKPKPKPKATEGEATEGKAIKGKATTDKATTDKATTDKATKGKDAKGKATKGKATTDKATKGKDAKGKATKGKEATGKETKGKSTKDKETQGKSAKGKSAQNKSAKGKAIKRKAIKLKPPKARPLSLTPGIQVTPVSRNPRKRNREDSEEDAQIGPISKVARIASPESDDAQMGSISEVTHAVSAELAKTSNLHYATDREGVNRVHALYDQEKLQLDASPWLMEPPKHLSHLYMMSGGLGRITDYMGNTILADSINAHHQLVSDRITHVRRLRPSRPILHESPMANYPLLDPSELEDVDVVAAPEAFVGTAHEDDRPVDWARVGQEAHDPEDFAENPDPTARVLFLNITDESAAGSNLTVAQHVIFLTPYYAEKTKYNSAMIQAMGRALRQGQEAGGTVTVHHLLVKDSVEIDIAHELMDEKFPGRRNASFLLDKHKSNIGPAFFRK
ncbi:hypothetical protein OCU04_004328 [Sclerotinia nivalis]|uniref:Uncharacterized protein n=1 Tax=Sclerotinia nivalis TaxID=352851 RepID=A0A9X0DKI1_9HELO|nr:hypothetical protein OCU04_004328 [Sclerotinia nivalis]